MALSRGMQEKFGISTGSTLKLTDKYEDKDYQFTTTDEYGSESAMAVYLPIGDFNETLGNDADYFNGYASNVALALDEKYVASDLTPGSMEKIAAQMLDSMGDMMDMMLGVAVCIFLVFMYLLTKTVIDRSARAISYMKVFGYRDNEINKLYIRSITWTVAVSVIACQPLIVSVLGVIFKGMLMDNAGNITVYVPPTAMVECAIVGLATYAVVAFLHMRRIKRVPMALALKVQE